MINQSKKVLVTGAAGFIGFHLCKKLLEQGYFVIGVDNINDYYSVSLKFDRLEELGILRNEAKNDGAFINSIIYDEFKFIKLDIQDKKELSTLFQDFNFDIVCNLAGQAGISHSLKNPEAFVQSNLVGFFNLLECCKNSGVGHMLFASSSSVYGLNDKIPFSEIDRTDHPISFYAATKKSNEVMAHSYSYLYGIPMTGLRFFTVYGPWGRPDMAIYLFTDAIAKGKPIKVFNHGKMERDFTYIDDIVESVSRIINNGPDKLKKNGLYYLYNIGNNKSVHLMDFITEIEKNMGVTAKKIMMGTQPGNVERTWANVDALSNDFKYTPNTSVADGVKEFVNWYKSYNKI